MSARNVRLDPAALFSAPVFFVSFAWAVIAHFTDISNNGIDRVLLRLAALAIVQVVFFVFPLLAWWVVCPKLAQRSKNRVLIVAIVIGAAVRGWAFGFILYRTGLTQTPGYAFRVLTSVANMATVTLLLWFAVSEMRSLQSRRRRLLQDRDQLLLLQATAQGDLEQLGSRAADEIRSVIVASLGTSAAASSRDLLGRLRVTIDEVVRPLSQQLSAQGTVWSPPLSPAENMRVNWLSAIRHGLDPVRIHPLIVTLALIWLGIPVHVVQYGPKYALFLMATGLVGFPVFWLSRRAAIRICAGRNQGFKITAFVIVALLGGESMGLASLVYMQSQPQPYLFVIMVPIFALLVSAPLAVAEDARDQSLAIEADLESTTADLRWTLARTREQHRQQERALAHALHGRIQASLASAIVRLDRAVSEGNDDAELVTALQREVMETLTSLDVRSTAPEPIDQVVALTTRSWEGAAEIAFEADAEAQDALAHDALCAEAVNDLIPELVFNSFRHGTATLIEINVRFITPRSLELKVTDNGTSDLTGSRHGLGTELLDAASLSWSRIRADQRTITTCLLPCLPVASM